MFKKTFLVITAICLVSSCKSEKPEDIASDGLPATGKTQPAENFTALKHSNKALILANSLTLFNKDKSPKNNVSGIYGLVIDLDSISERRFALGKIDDECQEYNFAYANNPKIKGWIHGKYIYQYLHDDRDTTFTIQDTEFRLYATKSMNVGVTNDGDLTFCGEENPIILYNSKYKKEALIPMAADTMYNSKYMVMDAFDGWEDKITDAKLIDDKLLLTIHREYQEGSADFVIEIKLLQNGYQGKVISHIRHEIE